MMDSTFNYTHPTWGLIQVFSSQTQDPIAWVKLLDMCGDLWHYGHGEFLMRALQKASEHFKTEPRNIQVVVGLYQDSEIAAYKRDPILSLDQRIRSALCCFYVDKVISRVPIILDKAFLDGCNISMVVHGDDFSPQSLAKYYSTAIQENKFMSVFYGDSGVSTSNLILKIKAAAEKKKEAQQDLKPS